MYGMDQDGEKPFKVLLNNLHVGSTLLHGKFLFLPFGLIRIS